MPLLAAAGSAGSLGQLDDLPVGSRRRHGSTRRLPSAHLRRQLSAQTYRPGRASAALGTVWLAGACQAADGERREP
jgi:hypothetical protein